MRVLKIICLFFLATSAVSIVEGTLRIHSSPAASTALRDSVYGTIMSIIVAVVWASVFFGVREKTPIAWKLGWGVIVVALLAFLLTALSHTLALPDADHPLVVSAAVVVVGCAATGYWGFWWNRQKRDFLTRASSDRKPDSW
jgi:uncharacterized membrane protein